MNPIILIPLFVLFVTVTGGSYIKGRLDGKATVQAAWEKAKAANAQRQVDAIARQREREQALQINVDNIRESKNREIRLLNTRAATLSDSLRDRPSQSQLPPAAEVGSAAPGCTGAGLYREHAEFLIGEATAAQQCRAYLAECRHAYESMTKD